MTKDDFFELIQEHKDYGGYVHQDTLSERLAELFTAVESKGQASDARMALESARHAVYMANTLGEAFNAVQSLLNASIEQERRNG